jgi:putative transposase
VWAELVPVPLVTDVDAVTRPRQEATVQRQEVRLHNRHYYAEALALYDKQRVLVEYDLHIDQMVWVRDLKGRLIAGAELVKTIGVLPMSRLEEGRERRLKGQVKRLEAKVHEAKLRSQTTIDNTAEQVHALEDMGAIDALAAPVFKQYPTVDSPAPATTTGSSDIEIDILTWRDN